MLFPQEPLTPPLFLTSRKRSIPLLNPPPLSALLVRDGGTVPFFTCLRGFGLLCSFFSRDLSQAPSEHYEGHFAKFEFSFSPFTPCFFFAVYPTPFSPQIWALVRVIPCHFLVWQPPSVFFFSDYGFFHESIQAVLSFQGFAYPPKPLSSALPPALLFFFFFLIPFGPSFVPPPGCWSFLLLPLVLKSFVTNPPPFVSFSPPVSVCFFVSYFGLFALLVWVRTTRPIL